MPKPRPGTQTRNSLAAIRRRLDECLQKVDVVGHAMRDYDFEKITVLYDQSIVRAFDALEVWTSSVEKGLRDEMTSRGLMGGSLPETAPKINSSESASSPKRKQKSRKN